MKFVPPCNDARCITFAQWCIDFFGGECRRAAALAAVVRPVVDDGERRRGSGSGWEEASIIPVTSRLRHAAAVIAWAV